MDKETTINQAIRMIADQDLSRWSDDHDEVTLLALRAALERPEHPVGSALTDAVRAHISDLEECLPTLRVHHLNKTADETEKAIAELRAALAATPKAAPAAVSDEHIYRLADMLWEQGHISSLSRDTAVIFGRAILALAAQPAVAPSDSAKPAPSEHIDWKALYEDMADLYAKAIAAAPTPDSKGAPKPVAYRYKDSRGHWRYCTSRPHEAYEILLKPEPLYLHPPSGAQAAGQEVEAIVKAALTWYGSSFKDEPEHELAMAVLRYNQALSAQSPASGGTT